MKIEIFPLHGAATPLERYLAKATTDLVCTAETTEADWAGAPDVPVHKATRSDGTVVVEGTIHLRVTPAGK